MQRPVLKTKLSELAKARSKLARLRKMKKNVSITEQPSLEIRLGSLKKTFWAFSSQTHQVTLVRMTFYKNPQSIFSVLVSHSIGIPYVSR
jgi:hypothetical protein